MSREREHVGLGMVPESRSRDKNKVSRMVEQAIVATKALTQTLYTRTQIALQKVYVVVVCALCLLEAASGGPIGQRARFLLMAACGGDVLSPIQPFEAAGARVVSLVAVVLCAWEGLRVCVCVFGRFVAGELFCRGKQQIAARCQSS